MVRHQNGCWSVKKCASVLPKGSLLGNPIQPGVALEKKYVYAKMSKCVSEVDGLDLLQCKLRGLVSKSRHKGTGSSSLESPVVDEEKSEADGCFPAFVSGL